MKLTEKRFLSLSANYRGAKCKYLNAVRDALREYLSKHNNKVIIPSEFAGDFLLYIDGCEEEITSITYSEKDKQIYVQFMQGDTEINYAWVFIEEQDYAVDAVMNLIFNKPPIFPKDSDEPDYGTSEYLEGDADARTGEIFDNYYK